MGSRSNSLMEEVKKKKLKRTLDKQQLELLLQFGSLESGGSMSSCFWSLNLLEHPIKSNI